MPRLRTFASWPGAACPLSSRQLRPPDASADTDPSKPRADPLSDPESRHAPCLRSNGSGPTSMSCPIRATSAKRTRGRGCSTGNNGGIGVQSQRHLFLDLGRWMASPSGVRPAPGPICAYCAVMPPSITSSEPGPRMIRRTPGTARHWRYPRRCRADPSACDRAALGARPDR